ncbi:MAG TPA: hypothetical protein VGD98_17875 [Ktedonobacteraceae bacterium]
MRTIFARKKTLGNSAGHWSVAEYRQWLYIFFLLCGASLISACGASAPSTTATLPHPQATPTISRPFHATVQTFDRDFAVTLDIAPDRSGPNQFHAQIMDNHVHKAANHVTVTLYTTMQDMPMGTDSIVLHADGGGQFSAASNVLSMSGNWGLGITLQTTDHVVHRAGVSFVLF